MIALLLAVFWLGYIWACGAKESDEPGDEELVFGIAVAISLLTLAMYGAWLVTR